MQMYGPIVLTLGVLDVGHVVGHFAAAKLHSVEDAHYL